MPLWFDRRGFLRAFGWALAGVSVPLKAGAHGFSAGAPGCIAPAARFFSDHERVSLEALCDRIVPPDADAGARSLGAAAYIEHLLMAFDGPQPRLFARGPFSGRNPFPNPFRGTPSLYRPKNEFRDSVGPSRLQELYWRAEILGSAAAGLPPHSTSSRAVPGSGFATSTAPRWRRSTRWRWQRSAFPSSS